MPRARQATSHSTRPTPSLPPSEPRPRLSKVLWLGGGTDAGKTTVARCLAANYGLRLYEYDRTDRAHHERLAERSPDWASFLAASLDERWLHSTREELKERALRSFADRMPLVIEDLEALAADGGRVLAEGFGLLPSLVAPLLSSRRQALWLLPTEAFKRESMLRRGKPSFRDRVSDPERAFENLLARDRLLSEHVRTEAAKLGLTVLEVDGSRSPEEMAALSAAHFEPFLPSP